MFFATRRSNSQPQGVARLDIGNPLARGIVAWQTGVALNGFEEANAPTYVSTTVPSVVGVARSFPYDTVGSSGPVLRQTIPTTNTSTTLVGLVRFNIATSDVFQQYGFVSTGRATPSNEQISLSVAGNGTNYNWLFEVGQGAAVTIIQPATVVDNNWHLVVGRQTSATSRDVWVDGVNLGSDTVSTDPTLIVRAYIGSAYGVTVPFNGDIALSVIYNRALSNAEIAQISRDPWQIFRIPSNQPLSLFDPTPPPASRTFFVPRKKVMSSQPQGPAEIDWGNPITRGLATVYVPTTRFPAQDLITKVLDTSTVRIVNSPGKRGAVAYSNTAIGYTWNMTFTPVGIPGNYAALSIFALFEQYDTTTGGTIWGAGNNATQQMRFFKNADGTVSLIPNSNSGGATINGPGLSTNTLYALGAINQGSYRELFVDGLSVASSNTSITFINSQYGFAGSPNLFGDPRRIGLYCGYAWTRLLTTPEIKSLSDNPWQIFKQDRLSPALAEDGKVYAPFMS